MRQEWRLKRTIPRHTARCGLEGTFGALSSFNPEVPFNLHLAKFRFHGSLRMRPDGPAQAFDDQQWLIEKNASVFDLFLTAFGAVFATAALTALHAGSVESAAHDVITHARQVAHATAANQHHRVLLKVVPFARDVSSHFDAVGEAHTGDLAHGGVRFLGRCGANHGADATAEGIALGHTLAFAGESIVAIQQSGRFLLFLYGLAPFSHELIDGGQRLTPDFCE
jgi:hypothetical protein